MFVQRKSSGQQRILIQLRRINLLLRHDSLNINLPFSFLTDTTNHFAGKSLFCRPDCSQVYPCVHMAIDLSVQLLAFNFAPRTIAYNYPAEGLNESFMGFSCSVRRYFDPCFTTNVYTKFIDDFAAGVDNFDEMMPAL